MSEKSLDKPLGASFPKASGMRAAVLGNAPLIVLIVFLLMAGLLRGLLGGDLNHPYLVARTDDGTTVTFLHYGQVQKNQCTRQLANMAQAMQTACPVCKVVETSCLKTLNAEQYDSLSEAPIAKPSARSAQGVIVYDAPTQAGALAACSLSEERSKDGALAGKIRCYAPNVERGFPADQHAKMVAVTSRLQGVFVIMVGLGLFAVIMVAAACKKSRATPGASLWVSKLTLAMTDTFVMLAAFAVLGFPDLDEHAALWQFDIKNLLAHGALLVITIGWFWVVFEHYGRRRPFWDELKEIYRILALQILLSGAAVFYADLDAGRGMTLVSWMSLFVLLPLGRAAARHLLDAFSLWRHPAVIIGTGENAQEACLALQNERGIGYHIIGFVSPVRSETNHAPLTLKGQRYPIFGGNEPIENTLKKLRNPQIVLALDNEDLEKSQSLIAQLTRTHPNLHFIPSIRGLPLYGMKLAHFFSHEVLFLTVRNNLSRRTHRWAKRGFDLIAASALLVLLSPLFVMLTYLIRRSGGPAFYGHPRIGQHGRPFKCLKFRSMRRDADKVLADLLAKDPQARAEWARDFKLKNDPRITAVGHFLRKTSLDELPQLINVIKGEMSLVGPRPIVEAELERYGEQVDLYLQALPGVTGLWQVSGRNDTGYAERVSLDAWYVQNWSMWYDIAILFKTISVVLDRRGAY